MAIDFISTAAFAKFVGQRRLSNYSTSFSSPETVDSEQQFSCSHRIEEPPQKRTRYATVPSELKSSYNLLSLQLSAFQLEGGTQTQATFPSSPPRKLPPISPISLLHTSSDCESSLSAPSSINTDSGIEHSPVRSLKRKTSSLQYNIPSQISPPSSDTSTPSVYSEDIFTQSKKRSSPKVQLKTGTPKTKFKKQERAYRCQYPGCSTSFSKANHLTRHIRIVHNGERPFACSKPGCGARFGSKSHLGDHTKAVHMKLRSYKCDICGAAWSKRYNLQKHIRVRHLRQKPYKCAHCDMSFGTLNHATRHELSVHQGSHSSQ